MAGPFDATSTADDVLQGINLHGKNILTTGASTVLEIEIIRALMTHGAHVIAADRDLEKARTATGELGGAGSLELLELDLGSLASVRSVADVVLAAAAPLDLVMANTGIVACPQGRTADGIETQLAINHIGHFVLINRLVPLLRPGSRVVIMSSPAHRLADVDLDDPNFDRTPYDEWISYGRASTAKILFGVEFDRRHRGRGIRAAIANPGAVRTEHSRHVAPRVIEDMAQTPEFHWKTIPQGAATALWAGLAADPDEIGGRYCEDCRVATVVHDPDVRGGVQSYAIDPERAKALWAVSEELVGETF